MKKKLLVVFAVSVIFLGIWIAVPFLSGCKGVRYLRSTPESENEHASIPQGMCFAGNDTASILLSCHEEDQRSLVYQVNASTFEVEAQFVLPEEASHTSGLAFVGDNTLISVDCRSGFVYFFDYTKSLAAGHLIELGQIESGLAWPSACCFFEHDGTPYLILTDFRSSKTSLILNFEKLQESQDVNASIVAEYQNGGFSQGVCVDGTYIYDVGNSLLGWSKVEVFRIEALLNGETGKVRRVYLPIFGIQDLVYRDGSFLTSDEVSRRFVEFSLWN